MPKSRAYAPAPFWVEMFARKSRGRLWEKRILFLDGTEAEWLEAPYYDDLDDAALRLICPTDLINVLEKVK